MKLRNKKTGEVKEVIVGGYPVSGKTKMWECSEMDCNEESGYKSLGTYNSLAELNEEWEDAPEEPKEDGLDNIIALAEAYSSNDSERYPKEIVEKLKAWKRLKDKGFKFTGCSLPSDKGMCICYETDIENWSMQDLQDFKTLFGGEE